MRGARDIVGKRLGRGKRHAEARDGVSSSVRLADVALFAAWLAPAVRRGYVKAVLDAKKEETRTRRIAKIVETLHAGVPERRTWRPSDDQ